LVDLKKLLGPRRRRKPRVDGPRTIVPAPAAATDSAATRFDAARDRLRREIPPPADD
jgi:hypothetical protein